MWSDYLRNLYGAEAGTTTQFIDPWAGMTLKALPDRMGKQANNTTEKQEMMRLESFLVNDGDQYY